MESLLKSWKHRLPARSSAAVLVVDHQALEVVAYLGSVDFTDSDRFAHVDMVQAIRSPGSTLKPFLYGLALDDGLIHSQSLLQDIPRIGMSYQPENFDRGFQGAVSVEQALQQSLNVPVVQLLEHYGAKRFTSELAHAGINLIFPQASEPNLSLILGGTGSNLQQLVSGYTALARAGRVGELRFVPDQQLVDKPLLSAGAAWITRSILQRQASAMANSQALAWKTGTSYGFRDAWAIGVNQRYVIGVWLGRPDATPVQQQSGVSSAMPLLQQINQLVQYQLPDTETSKLDQQTPASVTRQVICWPSGLASDVLEPQQCRVKKNAWLLNHTVPPSLDTPLAELLRLDSAGQWVGDNCGYSQQQVFYWWPPALEPWLAATESKAARLPAKSKVCPPLLTGAASSGLQVLGLEEDERLYLLADQQLMLPLTLLGSDQIAFWYLNGQYQGRTQAGATLLLPLTKIGRQQLSILDASGNALLLNFTLDRAENHE